MDKLLRALAFIEILLLHWQKCFISISGGVFLNSTVCFLFFSNFPLYRNLPAILDWVKTQKPGAMGVNIITSDFVDLVDFATTVIELNDLLQEDRALAKCWFNFLFNLMLNLLIQARVLKGFLLGWPLGSDGEVRRGGHLFFPTHRAIWIKLQSF